MSVKVKQKLGNEVTLHVIKPDGRRIKVAEKLPNLITELGMSRIGQQDLKEIFTPASSSVVECQWGDDNTSNSIDSGAITASQTGTTITASSGIFTLAMEGDLIKYDSGEEVYLQTYVSATEFTALTSETIASSEFTVYDVDRTQLENLVQTTKTLNATSTFVIDAGIAKGTAVFIFSAVGSAGTVREIGWESYAQSAISARVVVPDVALSIGDQLEVTTEFSVTQGYQTTTALDPTTGEGDFTGDIQVENPAIFGIGNSSNMQINSTSAAGLINETLAFVAYGSKQRHNLVDGYESASVSAAPTSAPWVRNKTWTFSSGEMNSTNIRGFIIGTGGNSSEQDAGLKINFDAAQTKTNLQTMTVVVPFTWDRNLSN